MASESERAVAPPRLRLNSSSDLLDSDSTSSGEMHARLPTSRSLTGGRGPGQGMRSPSSQGLPHNQLPRSDSSEHLLPPTRSRSRRFRDDPTSSSPTSVPESRRTSWSSSESTDGPVDPFGTPFDGSRAPSRAGSYDEGLNTQTVSEKYNIHPSSGLLLFPEDIEKDDYLHNPDPNDKDVRKCADLFNRRGLVNLGGLMFLGVGILMLFIGYPLLTFVQEQVADDTTTDSCSTDPLCISTTVALLENTRVSAIDPDTPTSAYTKTSADGTELTLVFSDEFEDEGRSFYDGDDAYFQGVNLWYGVTEDLEWYDPDAITTENGTLVIQFDAFENHDLNYRSGMFQSWNKLCFKGGRLEASISLPGAGDTIGFWPAFWAIGNLGRAGYPATTDGTWPYTYADVCDAGITANQSDPDGYNMLPGMRLPACTCVDADHPSPGISRAAPEIDVIEASAIQLNDGADYIGTASQSLQMAPFDRYWRSNVDYQYIVDYNITEMNAYQGGVYQEAASGVTNLNNDWYNGKEYQIYAFEYVPGADGNVTWYVGDDITWAIDGRSMGPNGNVDQRLIPVEPMTIVGNLGMSTSFASINYTGIESLLPAKMRFDYIRIYQDSTGELTCDPVGYPTTTYIADHPAAYDDANYTTWEEAGYTKPENSLLDGCTSDVQPEASIERIALWDCDDLVCDGSS